MTDPAAPARPTARSGFIPLSIAVGAGAVVLLGVLLVAHARGQVNKVALASEPRGVTVVAARAAPYRPFRRYVGTIQPWIEAKVGPQLISAYVDTVLVRPGDAVGRGQVIATLDCRGASASSRAVGMQARAIQAEQEAVAHEASRIAELKAGGFASPNEIEKHAADSASKQAEVLETQAKMQRATLEVNDCVLRAPFAGEISARLADPGAFVRPGMPVATVIDRNTVRITGEVPEEDFEVVAPGTPVRVHVLATDRQIGATVARQSPAADLSTRTIHLEIDVPDPDRSLPVGTTAELVVDVGQAVDAVEVPLTAASIRGAAATIFTVEAGIARKRVFAVKGERRGRLFVDASLPAGAEVVTEGRALLKDGDPVEVPPVTGLALRNPIAILMICVGLVVFAFVVTPRMSVDTFPELTPPVLVVGTLAPGLGPKDVEKTITWRIEKYVSATPGVDFVQSTSRNNLSVVFVWLKWGTDLDAAQTLVQQQVAFAMSAVPKSLGVLPPFVLQFDPSNAPVIQVAVSGGGLTGPQLYDYALNDIEPVLEGIPGVASASINGGRQRQINVVVDPTKAEARRITSSDVAAAVAQSNALLPSGEFLSTKFDANVYTNTVAQRISDIGEAAVEVRGGRAVLIKDVARVEDGGSPATQSVAVDGNDAVYLNVLRIPGGNTLKIVEAVKKAVRAVKNLPPGVEVKPIFDQSTFVRTSYEGLKKEVLQALVLIALVILLFLQSVRGTLIVSVAIPLSFAVALIILYAAGHTLNAFTLGGLTLAMGRLVDDAVVVLESIHRHQRQGMSSAEAALQGTNAVALPVLASTLTTMAVLLPVVLLEGLARKLFVPLAVTVAVSMIASYFVSMCVTPLCCRFFLAHHQPGRIGAGVAAFIDRVAGAYAAALRATLPYWKTVLGACAALVVVGVWMAMKLPTTFFPEIDESMERVYVRLAPGTSLEEATRKINGMATLLAKELPRGTVDLVLTNIGSPGNARSAMTSPNAGPHMGFIRVALVTPEHRKFSQRELADRMRVILNRNYPGVEFLQWPGGLVASVFSNGYLGPLVVEIGGDNLEALDAQSRAIAEVARTVPGIRDVFPSLQIDYPELRVETDRTLAALVDVSARAVAQTTLEATLGNINTPSVWVDGANGQSYYLVTSYDGRVVDDPNALRAIPVRIGENGGAVTLGAYSQVRRSTGPIAIERNHLERVAHVLMQTEGRDIGGAAAELEQKLRADPRTRDIPFTFVGQVDLMRTTFSGLGLAVGLAIMVVFMIMASQFKSLRLPFIMLFTIPVSLVGISLALVAAGQGFSITALMGVLMVVGIAVSNGILLIDDANRRYAEGADKLEAIVGAARTRFIPIAMTSLATVIGLIPTALGLEAGTESNQPLALAVVGGLASSTILSLFLVPVMFLLVAKRAVVEPARAGAPRTGQPLLEPS